MVELALAIAFVLFCLAFAYPIAKKIKQAIQGYQLSISQQFDEAEMLLKEARDLLKKNLKERDEAVVQASKIVDLSRQEVRFILEKTQKDILSSQEHHKQLFYHHTRALKAQWEKQLSDSLWLEVLHHAELLRKKASGQENFLFIQNRLPFLLNDLNKRKNY